MRLRRLDLIRYGKFSDAVLDFGAAERGTGDVAGPDLTIVYGENEAGKSTAFAAWLDLLFGLPLQTPHGYLHDRKNMVVGAVIEHGGEALTLRRTGARNESLTDEHGRAIAEHRLATMLCGLSREAYQSRFSLDESVLRDGGEEIARAQGDLGRLLHAGTSGLSGISDALAQIEKAVDEFHKKGGRATRLATAKRELSAITEDLREARVNPHDFDAAREVQERERRDLVQAQEAADETLRAVTLRQAADRRRDLAAHMQTQRVLLTEMPKGPDLPPDAVAAVVAAAEQALALDRQIATARSAMQRAVDTGAGLTKDADGLFIAATLDSLESALFDDGQSLLPRVQTAAADIGHRRTDRADLLTQARAIAERVAGAGADAGSVLLPRGVRVALRDAATALRDAERDLAALETSLRDTESGLGPEIAVPTGLPALADALLALHRDTADLQSLHSRAGDAATMAERAAIGLSADWHEIAQAGLPDDALLADLVARADAARAALADAATQCDEATEALAELEAERDATGTAGSATTDADITASRQQRETAWAAHLATLDPATARHFEAEMRNDDHLRDRHAATVEGRLRLAVLHQRIVQARTRVNRRRETFQTADGTVTGVLAEVAQAAAGLGLRAGAPVSALRPRHAALVAAQDSALNARALSDAAATATRRRDGLMLGLARAFKAAGGVVADPDRLLPEAERLQVALEGQTRQALARKVAAASQKQLASRTAAVRRDRDAAQQALQDQTAALWCAGRNAAAVLAMVPDLDDLADLDRQCADLDRRISRMEAALEVFETAAAPMRAALGLDPAVAVPALLSAARSRAETARATQSQLARCAAEEAGARDAIATALAEKALCTARIDEILDGQAADPASTPRQLVSRLAERDRARADLKRLSADHARAGAGFDPVALAVEEADTDPARTERVQHEAKQAQTLRDDALRRIGEADEAMRQLLARAGGADLDQKRAILLEDLRSDARTSAARLLGLMAAQGALRRFRQDRRGAMLDATERAFARLTHGEWPWLETQTMGKSERLVGVRNGVPVTADAMSTGTRGQLYLALRIAGHAEFVAENGPLPFITDDIHETFDDRRAAAALELAGEMGRLGQAIVFTHHRHLVALARETVPTAHVITLA